MLYPSKYQSKKPYSESDDLPQGVENWLFNEEAYTTFYGENDRVTVKFFAGGDGTFALCAMFHSNPNVAFPVKVDNLFVVTEYYKSLLDGEDHDVFNILKMDRDKMLAK